MAEYNDSAFLFGLDDIPLIDDSADGAPAAPAPQHPPFGAGRNMPVFAPLPAGFAPGSLPSFHAFPSYVAPMDALAPLPSAHIAVPAAPRGRPARTTPPPAAPALSSSLEAAAFDAQLSASWQGLSEPERRERALAAKRERNRLAAERCRAKRVTLIQDLQGTCAVLRAERDRLAEENRALLEMLQRTRLSGDRQNNP